MDYQRPEEREIEESRSRIADDIRAVGDSANIVQRAKDAVADRVDRTRDAVQGTVSGAMNRANDMMGGANDMVQGATGAVRDRVSDAADNPVGMLIGGFAIGFLVGMLLPVTRFERSTIGPMTEDLKDRVREAGSEAARRGKEVIRDSIDAAREAAVSSLQES